MEGRFNAVAVDRLLAYSDLTQAAPFLFAMLLLSVSTTWLQPDDRFVLPRTIERILRKELVIFARASSARQG